MKEEDYIELKKAQRGINFHMRSNLIGIGLIIVYVSILILFSFLTFIFMGYGFNTRGKKECQYLSPINLDSSPIQIAVTYSKNEKESLVGILEMCKKSTVKRAKDCYNQTHVVYGSKFHCSIDERIFNRNNQSYVVYLTSEFDVLLGETTLILIFFFVFFLFVLISAICCVVLIIYILKKYYDNKCMEKLRNEFYKDGDVNDLLYTLKSSTKGNKGHETSVLVENSASSLFPKAAFKHLKSTTVEENETIIWHFAPSMGGLIKEAVPIIIGCLVVHAIFLLVLIIIMIILEISRVQAWWQILFVVFLVLLSSPVPFLFVFYFISLAKTQYFITTSRIIVYKDMILFGYIFQAFFKDIIGAEVKKNDLYIRKKNKKVPVHMFSSLSNALIPQAIIYENLKKREENNDVEENETPKTQEKKPVEVEGKKSEEKVEIRIGEGSEEGEGEDTELL